MWSGEGSEFYSFSTGRKPHQYLPGLGGVGSFNVSKILQRIGFITVLGDFPDAFSTGMMEGWNKGMLGQKELHL
jgi:hypothetical protein